MEIPKIIHYCWFGRKPLPPEALRCIESWRKYCPDYRIVEWNEDNFDVAVCRYTKQAYKAKKYAFVSDYARFDILYRHGGLYFDTDVELLQSMDDILARGAFLGCEQDGADGRIAVNPGLGMGAPAELPIYRKALDEYLMRPFLNEDGSPDTTTIVTYTTNLLKANGLENTTGLQLVAGIWIYPEEYFCPINYRTGVKTFTANTHSIHHYAATWHTGHQRAVGKLTKIIGEQKMQRIVTLLHRLRGVE